MENRTVTFSLPGGISRSVLLEELAQEVDDLATDVDRQASGQPLLMQGWMVPQPLAVNQPLVFNPG